MPELFVYTRKGESSQLSLKEEKITIGRSSDNDIVVKDPYSSNLHAFIFHSDRGYRLKDNNSKNGTFLNGKRIKGEIGLKKGDEILIGSTRIVFDKEPATSVEITDDDSPVANVRTILPVKDVLKKADISSTIRAMAGKIDLGRIEKENRMISVMNDVSRELLLHRPKPELIDKIMELVNKYLPMDRGALMLMDGRPPRLRPESTRINEKKLANRAFQVSQNILNMVMDKHSALLIADVKDDTQLRRADSIIDQKIHSAMCVPLWIEDEIIGAIYLDRILIPKPFSEEDLRLLTLIANLAAVKIEDWKKSDQRRRDETIRKQLELAAQMQRDFLPKGSPEFGGFEIAGHNVPTYLVGGDYYNYIPLGPGRLGVVIADVSGKGPPAAFDMVMFRTRLEVEAVPGYDVQEMTALLNDFVHRKTDANRFISYFFCELDNTTGEMKYVNAGHNPPFVIKKGKKTERLGICGLCLGMFPSQKYETRSVTLEEGDLAVLYTDGITECRDENNEEFGERRFANLVKKNADRSAEELKEKIIEGLDLFTKGTNQMDDMTLVIIKRVAAKV